MNTKEKITAAKKRINELETLIRYWSMKKTIEKQKADFEEILEANRQMNILVQNLKEDLQNLDKRFNKKGRDIGKLALERTKEIDRIVNGGGKNAARCIELASGAEHTEAELKATLKSQINPECPALANPNYVPFK